MVKTKKKIEVAKAFMNARQECPHPNFNIIPSGFYKYLICRMCGRNMGEVNDIKQPNQ